MSNQELTLEELDNRIRLLLDLIGGEEAESLGQAYYDALRSNEGLESKQLLEANALLDYLRELAEQRGVLSSTAPFGGTAPRKVGRRAAANAEVQTAPEATSLPAENETRTSGTESPAFFEEDEAENASELWDNRETESDDVSTLAKPLTPQPVKASDVVETNDLPKVQIHTPDEVRQSEADVVDNGEPVIAEAVGWDADADEEITYERLIRQEFTEVKGGYDMDKVDAYLDSVADFLVKSQSGGTPSHTAAELKVVPAFPEAPKKLFGAKRGYAQSEVDEFVAKVAASLPADEIVTGTEEIEAVEAPVETVASETPVESTEQGEQVVRDFDIVVSSPEAERKRFSSFLTTDEEVEPSDKETEEEAPKP